MLSAEILIQKMALSVYDNPKNRLENGARIYDPPIIGFADAEDPLFNEMKKESVVGNIFILPGQWLPEASTVISYFLPFTSNVRSSNYEKDKPSYEWNHARFKGEAFSEDMRRLIIREIEIFGQRAVSPALENNYKVDNINFLSSWSERHVAYIAGLGTFSLSRGMITRKGMAGRFGSVITDAVFPITEREYSTPFQYCLWIDQGSCGACIDRCPSGAITASGKDKSKCHHLLTVEDPLRDMNKKYAYPYSSCGKCQTNVPCEDKIPE
jgi:epoxyqueuosine reductase